MAEDWELLTRTIEIYHANQMRHWLVSKWKGFLSKLGLLHFRLWNAKGAIVEQDENHERGAEQIVQYWDRMVFFKPVHEVAEIRREIAVSLEGVESWVDLFNSRAVATRTHELCMALSRLSRLAFDPICDDYHCTVKLIVNPYDYTDPQTVTLARSDDPTKQRDRNVGPSDIHPVSKNSDYAALLGMHDSITRWPTQPSFQYFCLNDCSPEACPDYVNDRSDWWLFYKSNVVLPIRYLSSNTKGVFTHTLGFLTIDNSRPNAFPGLPSIYEHKRDPHEFQRLSRDSAAWHLFAAQADELGTMFMQVFKRLPPPRGPRRYFSCWL